MKRNFEFTFSKALNFMKRGIRVSRTNMEGFVGLNLETDCPYFYHVENVALNAEYGKVWKPSTADLIAEDWITAEDKLDLL